MPFALIYILNIIVIIVLISTCVIKFQIKIKICGSVLTISHLTLLLTSLTGLLLFSLIFGQNFSCVISFLVKIFLCYLIFGQTFLVLSHLWSKFSCVISSLVKTFSCVISSLVKIFLCYLIFGQKFFVCYLIFGQNFLVLSHLWSKFSCVISSLVLSIIILSLSIISLVNKCIAVLYRQKLILEIDFSFFFSNFLIFLSRSDEKYHDFSMQGTHVEQMCK